MSASRLSSPMPFAPRRAAPLLRRLLAASMLAATGLALAAPPVGPSTVPNKLRFKMVRSPGIVNAGCLPNAAGYVKVTKGEEAETMDVFVRGLPPNTGFDFFVTQVPNPPFGLSWYQGDLQTDDWGNGHARYVGRFNVETFIIGLGAAPAPVVHGTPPDAATSPATNGAVHTYHLGLWFNSPTDAAQAGCPGFTTPFNGEHNAGVQVLNTANFANDQGPLRRLHP